VAVPIASERTTSGGCRYGSLACSSKPWRMALGWSASIGRWGLVMRVCRRSGEEASLQIDDFLGWISWPIHALLVRVGRPALRQLVFDGPRAVNLAQIDLLVKHVRVAI
jgi:hypothetical protein